MNAAFQRLHLIAGLCYGLAGMGLGLWMAATRDHSQLVTHAHLLLVGFLLSILYACIHQLWLTGANCWLMSIQLSLHHLGATGLVVGLFLLYGGHAGIDQLDPLLASSAIAATLGLFLVLVMTVVSFRQSTSQA